MTACEGIMVVEDDPSIRDLVCQILALEGYRVHAADNGKDALSKLERIPYPVLILLDLMMPVMNGWQFLEARKRNHALAELPVVVCSAVCDRFDPPEADECIRKPPDLETLLEVVRHHCTAPHNTPQQAVA